MRRTLPFALACSYLGRARYAIGQAMRAVGSEIEWLARDSQSACRKDLTPDQPIAQEPELHEWITSKDEKFKREYVLTDSMKFGAPHCKRD